VVAAGELFQSFTLRAQPAAPPLVKRWWFWAAIGAVAIAGATATYEVTRGTPSRLPAVTCDPAGCQP